MIAFPSGVRVWLATGHTDMRKGFDGLSLLVQETLKRDPHDGHLFVFRGRRGDLRRHDRRHRRQADPLKHDPRSQANGAAKRHEVGLPWHAAVARR